MFPAWSSFLSPQTPPCRILLHQCSWVIYGTELQNLLSYFVIHPKISIGDKFVLHCLGLCELLRSDVWDPLHNIIDSPGFCPRLLNCAVSIYLIHNYPVLQTLVVISPCSSWELTGNEIPSLSLKPRWHFVLPNICWQCFSKVLIQASNVLFLWNYGF